MKGVTFGLLICVRWQVIKVGVCKHTTQVIFCKTIKSHDCCKLCVSGDDREITHCCWFWGILTAERWVSICMMVGPLYPPDSCLHWAAVHVGTRAVPLGFFCFLWSTWFKVYAVCGWLTRSTSMSPLVMHSKNVFFFFLNKRIEVFFLSLCNYIFFSSLHGIIHALE